MFASTILLGILELSMSPLDNLSTEQLSVIGFVLFGQSGVIGLSRFEISRLGGGACAPLAKTSHRPGEGRLLGHFLLLLVGVGSGPIVW